MLKFNIKKIIDNSCYYCYDSIPLYFKINDDIFTKFIKFNEINKLNGVLEQKNTYLGLVNNLNYIIQNNPKFENDILNIFNFY
jgi:hypothetical protein